MQPIVIVNYGMGNLRSVQKALEHAGHAAIISGDPNQVAEARKVVLPGVGAFADAIRHLRQSGLDQPLLEHIRADRPFLGICLGLQMLFSKSYEDGEHEGLGVFAGEVVRFAAQPGLKVPHMGWNQILIRRPAPMLRDVPSVASVYFVHCYYVVPKDRDIIATETEYPSPFTSMIWRGNLFAMQFHPEKSQKVGLEMLRRFGEA